MTVELINIQYYLLPIDRAERSLSIQSKIVLPVNKIIEILIKYKCNKILMQRTLAVTFSQR